MSKSDASTRNDNILHRLGSFLGRGWKWRRSPLGPLQTLLTLMHMTVFSVRGSSAAMQKLFDEVGAGPLGWTAVPSDSAFSRARRKAKPEDLRGLVQTLRRECPHIDSHPQLRLKGFQRVVSVDGTKLPLCSQGTNKADFGCPSGNHLAPQALMTLLWDVGGNVPIDWRLGRYDESETGQLGQMMESLQVGDMLLGDRLYATCELMEGLLYAGVDFVLRVKAGSTALRIFADFAKADQREQIVTLPGKDGHRIRLVRGHRAGSETIIFATSVLDSTLLSAEAVADIYQRRWGVETAYREGKDWMALSNLPGRNRQQVEQEVAAVMVYWLMQGELEGQVRKKYAEEIARQKPAQTEGHAPTAKEIAELPVRFNRNLAAVIVGDVIRKGMASTKEAVTIWKVGLDNLWRHRSRRRPGRSYRRTSQRPHDLKKRDDIARAQAKGGRAKGC